MSNLPVVAQLRADLQNMQPQFQAALPAHVKPEKFVRVAMTALQTNPSLQNADRASLFASFTRAAQMGLLPDGREGAVVMFGQAAQFMPMIGGVLKLARNSGDLSSLDALVVRKNDKFTYRPGIDQVPMHEPDWFGERGEVIGVYAVAKTKDGAAYVEIMSKSDVEKVRQVSRAKGTGPWVQWWDEMARKTVLRRLAKRLPMSTDLEEAIHEDDAMFMPPEREQQATQPVEEVKRTPGKASRLQGLTQRQPEPAKIDADGVIDGELIEATAASTPADDVPL